jgi:hypothetical protein
VLASCLYLFQVALQVSEGHLFILDFFSQCGLKIAAIFLRKALNKLKMMYVTLCYFKKWSAIYDKTLWIYFFV